MTAPDPSPYLVTDRPCDGCGGVYPVTGPAADTMRGTPAHQILMRGMVPTTAQRAELDAIATEAAKSAGWLTDSPWRCPRCRERYGDTGTPRRFTVAETVARHQAAATP